MHLHSIASPLRPIHGYCNRVHRLLNLLVIAQGVPVLSRASESVLAAISHLVLELIDLHLVRLRVANVVFTMTHNDYMRMKS